MKNINQRNTGLEFGIEKTFLSQHILQGAIGVGENVYSNRPLLDAWQDNNSKPLFENRKTYLVNYRAGSTPQLAAGAGYKYNGKKFWSAALYANYFDKIYVEPNPDRRTAEATEKFQANESDLASSILRQEKLPSYYILNASVGKFFSWKKKYFLNLNLSVANLLNNRNIVVNGYESLRWDPSDLEKLGNKYSYMNGVSYQFTASFGF
jgi:hypothetical protein